MSAFKLNTILNNTSMKFIASIDPKTITSIQPFSNAMLDGKVVQQLELELAQSYKLFKNKVKRFVSNEVQISNLEQVFQEYIAGLETTEDKSSHSEFHIQLMTSNKNTKSKWLSVALTELIAQELTTSRYVELNHIAYLVGKTLLNKEHNGDAVIALSLGANILEFFRSINIVSKGYQINQEKHRIASIKVNRNVIKVPSNLLQAANSIRANSPMLVTPLKHSPLSEGGQLLRRCVMLNNAKLDHGMKFYDAVNYLNSQALKIRTNNDIINQWFMSERFYSDALTELKQEKTKVLNDLELFSKDRFYISYEADTRGRLYSTSNYINPQGDSFQKSMFVGEAEVLTEDGINIISNVHLNFSQYLSVGEVITIRYTSDPNTWETTTVSEIVSGNHIRVSQAVTPITTPSIYGWHDVTLGSFVGGQAQSWAVPLVAGKLKVIKMTTMADWDTVRAAARATAKRNPTGISEIDNTNWDIYRGFGCIDVQAAIAYINNL